MNRIASVRLEIDKTRRLQREPVVTGIPVPRGEVFDSASLRLRTAGGAFQQAYFAVSARWPDGSCKWVTAYYQVDPQCDYLEVYYVDKNIRPHESSQVHDQQRLVIAQEQGSIINVDTGVAIFIIDLDHSLPFKQVIVSDTEQLSTTGSRLTMEDSRGNALNLKILSFDLGDSHNSLQRNLVFKGNFHSSTREPFVEFAMEVSFFAGLATARINLTILNPRAAIHSKGVWDLGDAGSVLFGNLVQEVCLSTKLQEDILSTIKLEECTKWEAMGCGRYSLYQDSSGGHNWQSNNHVNARNEVPIRFRGYRGFRNDVEVHRGFRASPLFKCESSSVHLCAYIDKFWQNFPKEVVVDRNRILLKLFTEQFSDIYELQGGEQKTHTYFLDFDANSGASDWFTSPRLTHVDAEFFARAKLFPFLPTATDDDELQQIINIGIIGENNFFEKREIIDEYGWRNFGEIYADHEQLEYSGSLLLVSHYNNQYDALDGFIRQYIVSRNKQWFELARDLARHVVDIDIYNTTADRDEYNGGLFWHTDHYSNAFTCTHRTFSAKNLTSSGKDFGGGPGTEHCYTAGLANYYFLTGEVVYKEAVLKLVNWISISLDGSGALSERIHQFLTKDVSTIRKLLSGHSLQKYRYPFTRATGNYIGSLLDAYQLTDDLNYLRRIETVIRQTVHPRDDISLRQLSNVEFHWSYLIFLQAVCKYLVAKATIEEFDVEFCYAKESLLHYATWILDNERPFLESSEHLDFANSTWTAQDLRKAHILRVAACFNSRNKRKYSEKSEYYTEYVKYQLKDDEHRHYTRIIVILMQNYLPVHTRIEDWLGNHADLPANPDFGTAPMHSLSGVFIDFAGDCFKRLCQLSISKEIRWLRFRIRNRYSRS